MSGAVVAPLLLDGLRSFARTKWSTTVSMTLLALGLAATMVALSLLEGVLLRPLPFHRPDQLVRIYESNAGMYDRFSVAAGKYVIWERELRAFSKMAMFKEQSANLTGLGMPERLRTLTATRAFFSTLGAAFSIGRGFDHVRDADAAVVLTHRGWSTLFGERTDVIGQSMTLNGRPHTIVGVLSRDFSFSSSEIAAYTLWIPGNGEEQEIGKHSAGVIARLAQGQSLAAANQELVQLAITIEPMFGRRSLGWSAFAIPLADDMLGAIRTQLLMAQLFALLLLLGTVSSVVGLGMLRTAQRSVEFGIREALGAQPRRLAASCIGDGLILAIAAYLIALLLAAVGTWYAGQVFQGVLPRAEGVTLGWRVCLVAAVASLFVGTLLGIMSARRASGLPLTQLLAGARHGTRNDAAAHHTLVVGKVCLAFVLLAVGSTFWRGLERVADSDFGFSPDTVSYVRLSLPESAYPDMAAISTFHARLLGALEQSHLLQGSSIAQSIPIVRSYRLAYRIEGDVEGGEDERTAQYYAVSPAYFDLLGIRLLSGRTLSDADTGTSRPTIVVSREFAERHFPGRDPIGQRVRPVNEREWREIVGVVQGVRQYADSTESQPQAYAPITQLPFADTYLLIPGRSGQSAGLRQELARVVASVDPMLPIDVPRSLEDAISRSLQLDRSLLLFSIGFGAFTLALAAAGLYAALSMAIHRDSRRIAIELAIGRTPYGVVSGVLRRGLLSAFIGCGLGAVLALAVTAALRSALPGLQIVSVIDAMLVGTAVLGVCVLACLIPAIRAAAIHPARLLTAS